MLQAQACWAQNVGNSEQKAKNGGGDGRCVGGRGMGENVLGAYPPLLALAVISPCWEWQVFTFKFDPASTMSNQRSRGI